MERKSGILMPISSLPSKHGIGTFGKEAYKFADFLAAAGQRAWQLLPLGPTSYGDSPYSSFSTYAGNPYFIDLDMLVADGLLTKAEVEAPDWGDDPANVDYGKIYENRLTCCASPASAAGTATRRNSPPSASRTRAGCRITRCSWRSSGTSAWCPGRSGPTRP